MSEADTPPPISPEPRSRMLGKWMSAAMVVGTVVGSGIYLLPTTLAPYGPNLIWAFLVAGAGTLCLAITLAWLAARIAGGPFAYVNQAFGETAAFVTVWSYMVSQWTGVAAVTVAVAGAIGHVVPAAGSGAGLIGVAIGSILVLTIVNLRGARSAGWVQVTATLIKLVPLVLVVLLVVWRTGSGNAVEPLAPVPTTLGAIAIAGALMLFSFTGFEAATVTANVTRDSQRTVPIATVGGTAFTALIYLLATVATLMLLPSAIAANSSAPFADAIAPILGGAAGGLVALIAAISAFGTANALLLLGGESGRTLARAGDLPGIFRRTNSLGAPAGSLLVAASIAALLVLASSSKSFVPLYIFMTLVSAVSALVLYAICAAAALKMRVSGAMIVVAVLALVYSLAMFVGAGLEPTLWGLALAAAGLPIRSISRRLGGSSRAAAANSAAPPESSS
jgi:APA family basic amino acid/polyamine antiporter